MAAANISSHSGQVRNPGPVKISGSMTGTFAAFIVIGLAAFFLTVGSDPKRAWASFVLNHFYFMSLAILGGFFAGIQWLTGAMWSAPVRRLYESFTAYLPVALITFLLLYFGMHTLYPWTHAEHVQGDPVLAGKSGYLSTGFFFIRNIVAIAAWIFFVMKMVGNSLLQDTTRDPRLTDKNKSLAPLFIIIFAITYTMASFDQVMSLDPHWFSTMFGVYCFAGAFYAMHGLTGVMTVWLRRNGTLEGIVNDNHIHDLGKWMFAFTVFYAYIGFSQFMLIWYANMPEETGYYLHRFHGEWFWVSCFLLVGKFMVPFFLMLPRGSKRSMNMVFGVGIFMLFAHWVDLLWIVQPEFFEDGPRIGFTEIGVALGFLGAFGLLVTRFLAKNNAVAIGDPKLAESVFHHHQ